MLAKRALNEFELSINERKTAIIELPVLIEETWVSDLRSFTIEDSTSHKKQRVDLVRYFDKSFQLVKQNPHEHVLNYSVQRLRAIKIHQQNWALVQDFLLQCMMIETGTIRSALFMFKEYSDPKKHGFSIDKGDLSDVLNYQAWQQSRNGYLNEVAWSIWAMIYWEIKMSDKAAKEVSKIEDSFVALLALDASSRGLANGNLDTSLWEKRLETPELEGIQWLLSYEAQIQGWLSGKSGNHVSSHSCFSELEKHSVRFYDKSKMADLVEHNRPTY